LFSRLIIETVLAIGTVAVVLGDAQDLILQRVNQHGVFVDLEVAGRFGAAQP
jgi:hypothetical protein